MHWGIDLPVFNKIHGGINLPVFNKYTGALICLCHKIHWGINLPVSNNNTNAFIFLCLTNKRLKYLLLSNKFIYIILYQYNGNKDEGILKLKIPMMYIF